MKHWKHGIAAALAVAIGMALAAPPAFARTCGEVDVGKDASAKKDLGAKTASDNMAQEGVVLNAIAGRQIIAQEEAAAVEHIMPASPMAIVKEIGACAAKEVAIAEKAGGDAFGAFRA